MNLIEGLSTWAEQIIVAVVIAGIIEMILPSGNSKKYIKAVIGVYILFTIISPIIGKVTNIDLDDIDYEKYLEKYSSCETISESLQVNNNESIEEIYKASLKQDMTSKLQEKGYGVDSIYLEIEEKDNANYGKINLIKLNAYKLEKEIKNNNSIEIGKIEKVTIGNTLQVSNVEKDELKENEKNEIKEYLSSVYEVKNKNIKINEE